MITVRAKTPIAAAVRLLLVAALLGCGATGAMSPASPAVADVVDGSSTGLQWQAYRSFTTEDGLPHNTIFALLQDPQGFLYAGTEQGLARYDGRAWVTIELPEQQRTAAVLSLALDAEGALWLGLDQDGALLWSHNQFQPVALPEPAQLVRALWPAPDGWMWIGAANGLFRCQARVCKTIPGFEHGGVRSLLGEEKGGQQYLWIGTGELGLTRLALDGGAQVREVGPRLDKSDGLPNSVVIALARFGTAPDPPLWIGTGRGLARYDGQSVRRYSSAEGFPTAMNFALLADADSHGAPRLFAALRPGGLALLDPQGNWQLQDARQALPANSIHSLLRERYRGGLWLGTRSAGVLRAEPRRWAMLDERMGLPNRASAGVGTLGPQRDLWVGTSGGAVRWTPDGFVPLLPPQMDANTLVYDAVQAPDGLLWLATSTGLLALRDGQLAQRHAVDSSALISVSVEHLALLYRPDGAYDLYVGSGHGLVRWRSTHGEVERIPELPEALTSRAISALKSTTDGMWIAGAEGLWWLEQGQISRPADRCLGGQQVQDLAMSEAHGAPTFWLAARAGLWKWDHAGTCVELLAARALGTLSRIELTPEAIFVFGPRGALQLPLNADAADRGIHYSAQDGLTHADAAATAVDASGRIYAATVAGLAAFDPAARPGQSAIAPLHLIRASGGDPSMELQPSVRLRPDQSDVHFEYRLLAFEAEHRHRYQVQLEGLDPLPRPWSAQSQISFERLPPGSYRLRVAARDADERLATPLEFPFSVEAWWWQRPWAMLAAGMTLLLLGALFGRWRISRALKRAEQLEAEVALRTRDLADANTRLEEVALTDPLTGLKNRRYFGQVAAALLAHACAAGPERCLLVALLDIDHFKRINDTHGHDAGDAVLVAVAQALRGVAGATATVLRWGGEEFLLLLPDLSRSDLDARLHSVLQAVAELHLDSSAQVQVRVSIGALAYPMDPLLPALHSLEQAINLADTALYQAKRGGRDRAVRLISAAGESISVLRDNARPSRSQDGSTC